LPESRLPCLEAWLFFQSCLVRDLRALRLDLRALFVSLPRSPFRALFRALLTPLPWLLRALLFPLPILNWTLLWVRRGLAPVVLRLSATSGFSTCTALWRSAAEQATDIRSSLAASKCCSSFSTCSLSLLSNLCF
jgi:hypothetical protein